MFQFKIKNTGVRGECIKCTNCNKHIHFYISILILEDIIPVFIKAIVFNHVGISYIIKSKEKIEFPVDDFLLAGKKKSRGIMQNFFTTCMALYLNISL